MKQQGVVPNVITYNALLGLARKGIQLEQALEHVAAMKQQGLVPNVINYSALMSACEKGVQLEQALEHGSLFVMGQQKQVSGRHRDTCVNITNYRNSCKL